MWYLPGRYSEWNRKCAGKPFRFCFHSPVLRHEGGEHGSSGGPRGSASGGAAGGRFSPGGRAVCGRCVRKEQHPDRGSEGGAPQHAGGQTHLLSVRVGGGRLIGQPRPGSLRPGEPGPVPAAVLRLLQPAAAAGLPVPERRDQPRRRPRLVERPGPPALPAPALHVLRVPRPAAGPPQPDLRCDLRPAVPGPGRPAAEGPAPDPGCHQRLRGVQRVEAELQAVSSAAAVRLPDECDSEGLSCSFCCFSSGFMLKLQPFSFRRVSFPKRVWS